MHGPIWLENPIISLVLFAIAFYLLYRALITEKHHREPQHSNSSYNVEKMLLGHKIIDTSKGWLFFTSFLALVALSAHFLAEYTFHLYDITPIDRFTHGLSGMALTAIVLNLYLTRNRKYYYNVSIAASWVAFVLWEVYEWIYATYSGPSGFIQTEPWDMAIDLWVDSLALWQYASSAMNLQRAKKQSYQFCEGRGSLGALNMHMHIHNHLPLSIFWHWI